MYILAPHSTFLEEGITRTIIFLWDFPGSSDGNDSTCNAGDSGLIPGSGRSPGERNTLNNLSKVTHLLSEGSAKPVPSCVLFLTCLPGHFLNVLWFHHILLEMFNFQLEITGASLCGRKFTFVFFSSEKEALGRIRLEEKPSHFRSSEEEDSSESSISSLVRTAVFKKLLINLIHLF